MTYKQTDQYTYRWKDRRAYGKISLPIRKYRGGGGGRTGKRSVKRQGWENAILQIGSTICYFNLELWNRREMKSRQCTFLYHLSSSFLLRKSTSLVFIPISHPLSPPPFSVVLPNRRVHRIFQRGGSYRYAYLTNARMTRTIFFTKHYWEVKVWVLPPPPCLRCCFLILYLWLGDNIYSFSFSPIQFAAAIDTFHWHSHILTHTHTHTHTLLHTCSHTRMDSNVLLHIMYNLSC